MSNWVPVDFAPVVQTGLGLSVTFGLCTDHVRAGNAATMESARQSRQTPPCSTMRLVASVRTVGEVLPASMRIDVTNTA